MLDVLGLERGHCLIVVEVWVLEYLGASLILQPVNFHVDGVWRILVTVVDGPFNAANAFWTDISLQIDDVCSEVAQLVLLC